MTLAFQNLILRSILALVFSRNNEKKIYIWALKIFNNIHGYGLQPFVIVSVKELVLTIAIEVVF